jgi:hypothetical protein
MPIFPSAQRPKLKKERKETKWSCLQVEERIKRISLIKIMNDSFAGTNVRKTNNVTDTHHSLSLSLFKFCSTCINQNFITSLLYSQITLKIKIKISPIFYYFLSFSFPLSLKTQVSDTPISHLFINHSQDFYEEFPHLCFLKKNGIAQLLVMSLEF